VQNNAQIIMTCLNFGYVDFNYVKSLTNFTYARNGYHLAAVLY